MPPRQIIQQDLSKGANIVTNPYDINERQSIRVLNLILDEHGSLRTRPGTTIITAAPEDGRRIIRVYDFVKVDLTVIPLAVLRGNTALPVPANTNTLYLRTNSVDDPWTLITEFDGINNITDMVTFNDLVVIAAGYEVPWVYDGTATGRVTDLPGAQHIALHLGSAWVWNTAALTTTFDGPSSLRSSDVDDPLTWPTAFQVFVSKDDGQQGQGLGQFTIAESGISPTDTMIAFKDNSAYQVTGVFESDNFSIQKIKSDMGCRAPRTIQFVSGFGILRLTHRGVAQFNGVDDTLVSEEIRPLLFGGFGYTGIDWDNVSVAYACQVQNPPLYLLFCPTDGPALTRCFCYDLVRQSWTVLQYAVPFSSVQLISDPNELPIVLAGDYAATIATNAKVRILFGDEESDDCTPPGIEWELLCRPGTMPSAQVPSYFRRSTVKVINVRENQVIHGLGIMGPNINGTPRTVQHDMICPATVLPTAGSGLGYGIQPWGTSPYGSDIPNSELDLTFDVGLIGTNYRLFLSGVGPIIIRGIEHHVVPKAPARSNPIAFNY